MDWKCEGAKASSPIDVYVAQTGSGTYSSWQGALGFSKTHPGGVENAGMEAGWVANGGSPSTLISAHENLFENQMSTIAAQPDAKDAIYFMSFGKFTTTCAGKKPVCAGTGTNLTTFGQINGVTASQVHHPGHRWWRRRDLPGHPWPVQRLQQLDRHGPVQPGHAELQSVRTASSASPPRLPRSTPRRASSTARRSRTPSRPTGSSRWTCPAARSPRAVFPPLAPSPTPATRPATTLRPTPERRTTASASSPPAPESEHHAGAVPRRSSTEAPLRR